jgi:FtsP/CotA-like multicopper oxidase with cupredoxin domain
MNRKPKWAASGAALMGAALLAGASACTQSDAEKAEYWLCAKAGSMTMPDGVSVPIWGFVRDEEGFRAGCAGEARLPGPTLQVFDHDATLTVHLRNLLPDPTSIVVPGQAAAMTPVWWDPATPGTVVKGTRTSLAQRVRSFTKEAAPDGGEATYTWNVRPGTFLYHSGTQPQVQVQMGLYGAVVRNSHDRMKATLPFGVDPAEAYPDVPYDVSALLVFSEIDPVQHVAIANGTFGRPPDPGQPPAPTSTLHYRPRYYLVNGRAYTEATPPLVLHRGERTLLRLVNAGLQSYVPALQGLHMRMIAQDGHPYPWGRNPREQYETLLPSLQTVDAIVLPTILSSAATQYALYDRRLNLTTGAQPDGGMMRRIEVRSP